MGEKKKKNSNGEAQQKEGAESKKGDNGGGKNNVTVVLKADLHCEGCVSKVLKCIRSFDGVDTASIGDEQRITVVGKVDPVKLRERVEQKTHKKVELISPQPKKDNANKKNGDGKENAKIDGGNSGGDGKQEKKKEGKDNNSSKNKSDEKKSKEKEPPVTTAVLKVHLHCEGCIQKIHKAVTKTKGYQEMKIDRQKELVTVTGAMDMKALAEVLKKHLKKEVEILPPKKEVEKKENGGGSGDKGKSSRAAERRGRLTVERRGRVVGGQEEEVRRWPAARRWKRTECSFRSGTRTRICTARVLWARGTRSSCTTTRMDTDPTMHPKSLATRTPMRAVLCEGMGKWVLVNKTETKG
ncbi:heavy metal-associated isoprenylated plant protein 3 isoform X2 [Sesamum indicum]|uniref:Heavy metal-associated isoprenylated plant protein 3 isoform X2 n=1 Tax=Sesamum indicum TaxID=4182 RepID=A0A6I9TVG5_SESIN|nr:heavy metal-associated isoprenylated plant protein 3 isoform X2 [Sesamum indicum]